jgi:uncharacterized protein YecT (DUF1311 family)
MLFPKMRTYPRLIRRSILSVAAWLFLFDVSPAQQPAKPKDAPSEERVCDQAQSQMELNQCSGEQYRKTDDRLNAVYRKALDFMQKNLSDARAHGDADEEKYNQAAIEKLKGAEKAWIQYRDLHCDAARHQVGAGSMAPMVWAFCMAGVTEHRIEELKDAYENPDRKLE